MFPALSMMDLSDNKISEVPQNIHELVIFGGAKIPESGSDLSVSTNPYL